MGKDSELVILFADVVGSTRLFEELGDVAARDIVAICVGVMRRATEQHGGKVIKTMGDEIMATFEDCDGALDAAVQMQTEINAHPALTIDGQQVAIRVGAHCGPVMVEARDVFGAAVHTANRMTSQAKAGQIIITEAIYRRLASEWQQSARRLDVSVPRGQHGEIAVYEVLWQGEDVTSMLPAIATITEHHRPFHIKLRYGGREIVLDDRQRPSVTIGRGEENDLVVKGNLVSRLHARIEAGKNRFMLVDESTNGSFVQTVTGDDAFVRRDAMPLKGSGVIGLGRVPEPESYHTIEFFCDET
jgi:class 3 adenylate cyclase